MSCYRDSLLFLISIAYLFEISSAEVNCKPDCSLVKVKCIDPRCPANQIEKRVPELCRCCPQCYAVKGLGERCGLQIFAVCKKGLICINNKCSSPSKENIIIHKV
uniref:Serine protease HTRA3-like n=1 Tax=Diabrotica virgifera virgifera TaxID=50390 RepID=A0A6P7FI24_DIAVI